jgi:hypothetical protein
VHLDFQEEPPELLVVVAAAARLQAGQMASVRLEVVEELAF